MIKFLSSSPDARYLPMTIAQASRTENILKRLRPDWDYKLYWRHAARKLNPYGKALEKAREAPLLLKEGRGVRGDIVKRLSILIGERLAGNDSNKIITEIKTIANKLKNTKRITSQEHNIIISENT